MRTQDKDVKGLGRVVHGLFNASAGIVSGTGFRVTKNGTGLFVITFLVPFKAAPHGGAICSSSGAQIAGAQGNDPFTMAVNVFAANGTGALADPLAPVTFWAWEVDPA